MIRNAESQQVIQQDFFVTKHPDLSNNLTIWWWHNPTNPNSLRLTKLAFEVLTKVKQHKFYKFKLIHDIKPKTFVQLERYFTEPYYIQNHTTIFIMGEREAMMVGLHANNLQQYLDNHSR